MLLDEDGDEELRRAVLSPARPPDVHSGRIEEDIPVVQVETVVDQDIYSHLYCVPGEHLELQDIVLEGL